MCGGQGAMVVHQRQSVCMCVCARMCTYIEREREVQTPTRASSLGFFRGSLAPSVGRDMYGVEVNRTLITRYFLTKQPVFKCPFSKKEHEVGKRLYFWLLT